jgi:hypothetical protein
MVKAHLKDGITAFTMQLEKEEEAKTKIERKKNRECCKHF